jgi:hypothetical protein
VERPEEGVLADVLGFVWSHHASGHPEDHVGVAFNKLAEGAQLAATGPLDELAVRIVHLEIVYPYDLPHTTGVTPA